MTPRELLIAVREKISDPERWHPRAVSESQITGQDLYSGADEIWSCGQNVPTCVRKEARRLVERSLRRLREERLCKRLPVARSWKTGDLDDFERDARHVDVIALFDKAIKEAE